LANLNPNWYNFVTSITEYTKLILSIAMGKIISHDSTEGTDEVIHEFIFYNLFGKYWLKTRIILIDLFSIRAIRG